MSQNIAHHNDDDDFSVIDEVVVIVDEIKHLFSHCLHTFDCKQARFAIES